MTPPNLGGKDGNCSPRMVTVALGAPVTVFIRSAARQLPVEKSADATKHAIRMARLIMRDLPRRSI
jgi:hypothetical protein